MNKLLLLTSFILLISMASALTTYDSFTGYDLNKWMNISVPPSAGSVDVTETATYLEDSCNIGGVNDGYVILSSTNFPNPYTLLNATFNVSLTKGGTTTPNFKLFGNILTTAASNNLYRLYRNTSITNNVSFDVYKNGVFDSTINISDSVINMNLTCPTASSGSVRLYKAEYEPLPTNYTFNSTTYETSYETIKYNINASGSLTSSALIYNGNQYSSTLTSLGGNNYTIISTVNVPLTNGTIYVPLYFKFTQGGVEYNTTTTYQEIKPIAFTLCNSTYFNPYVNFTFRNETIAQEQVNAKLQNFNFNYYKGTGTISKTLTFSNTTGENRAYLFCSNNYNVSFKSQTSGYYYNSESKIRSYSSGETTYNNPTFPVKTLYLLPTTLGQDVTLQVINIAQQSVAGALVNITSSLGLIQTGVTDSAGSVTFFLSPTTSYTIRASASGYGQTSLSLTPSLTSYTITLGSSGSNQSDYTNGISTYVRPQIGELLNGTSYSFNLTLTSTYYSLSQFGFTLTNGSNIIGSISSGSNGGTVNIINSTENNSLIVMNYYWVVNNTYSNASVYWTVINSDGSAWSLKTFFTDLKSYTSSGIFGLNSFGVGIFVFLLIFIFTGVLSYKFGLTSMSAIMIIMWLFVAFFDFVVGIMPNPFGAIPHFPTYFIGLIVISVFLKEAIY